MSIINRINFKILANKHFSIILRVVQWFSISRQWQYNPFISKITYNLPSSSLQNRQIFNEQMQTTICKMKKQKKWLPINSKLHELSETLQELQIQKYLNTQKEFKEISNNQISNALNLVEVFLTDFENPFKSMINLTKMMQVAHHCQSQGKHTYFPLFKDTLFPQVAHRLLTVYLSKRTGYQNRISNSGKGANIFHKYILQQHPELYERLINQKVLQINSISQWFEIHYSNSLFTAYYKNSPEKKTKLLRNYMIYGFSYLLVVAIGVIEGSDRGLLSNQDKNFMMQLQNARISYVKKYQAQSL